MARCVAGQDGLSFGHGVDKYDAVDGGPYLVVVPKGREGQDAADDGASHGVAHEQDRVTGCLGLGSSEPCGCNPVRR